jgi:methyl-accepting chemotaxis protein
LRVSSLFNFVISLVGLVAIGFALSHLRAAWTDLNSQTTAEGFAVSLQAAGKVRDAITIERGTVNAALRSPSVDQSTATRLRNEPGETDAALKTLRAALARSGTAQGRELEAQAAKIAEAMAAGRADAKRMFDLAPDKRNPTEIKAYFDRMDTQRDATGKLVDRLDVGVYRADSGNADLLVIASLSDELRRIAGDRAVILTTLLASGQPATGNELDRFLTLSGRIDELWLLIQRNVTRIDNPGALRDALDQVDNKFFKTVATLYQPLMPVLRGGPLQNPDLAGFRSRQSPALDATLTVRDTALDRLIAQTRTGQAEARVMLWAMIAASVAVVLLVVGAALYFRRRVITPLGSLTGSVEKLAAGDLAVEVAHAQRQDEIGAIGRALAVFRDNAVAARALEEQAVEARQRDAQRLEEDAARQREAMEAERRREVEARQAEEVRQRDAADATRRAEAERQAETERLRHEAESQRKAELNELASSFQSAVGGVVDAVASAATEMQATATSMTGIADRTAQQSMAASAATEQAAANVQTVASASEELSASIREIASQVANSSRIASAAVAQAQRTDAIVQGLASSAEKIGEVVGLINQIAGQTNLLALNATIEAARAGEAGKGFAVVASEVKNLATQTSKATDEIGQQIGSVQNATQEAVAAIREIGGVIGQINEIAGAIAAAVEEQGAATGEIARSVEQAANGTREASANVGEVNQSAREAGSAAGQVLDASGELSRQAERLRAEVGRFLARIRAD